MADTNPDKEQQKQKQEEQKQADKPVAIVCTLNLRLILVALHEKALSEIKGDLIVQNSAIEGSGGKDAKFYGAGQHIIAAIPKDNKGLDKNKVKRADAVPVLLTYVLWFVGPDVKNEVKEDILKPLENGAEGKVADNHEKKEDIEKSKADSVAGEKYKESKIFVPSFSQYLLTEEGEEGEESKDSEKEDAEKKEEPTEKKEEKEPETGDPEAQGWYLDYKMIIPGQKESSITDALKSFGKDLVKAFGIQITSFGGNVGDKHTIGGLMDDLDSVFGKLDAKQFESLFNEEMTKKMKQTEARAAVWDTKTILKYLKKEVAHDKAKITPALYALCVRVDKNDKSYDLFTEDEVANIVNAAINGAMRGVFKKKFYGVKGKDVIRVNNYQDNKKAKDNEKFVTDKAEGAVRDSLIVVCKHPIIVENKKDILATLISNRCTCNRFSLRDSNTISLMKMLNLNESLILEAGRHTAQHIKLLIDKVGSKQISANKEKILSALRADYSGKGKASEIRDELIGVKEKTKEEEWDKKRIAGWNKKHPDDKREEGYKEKVVVKEGKPGKIEEFFKLSDDDAMKKWVDENFGKIEKTDDGEPLVQAFWKALSLLPEKEDKEIEITFIDKDPNERDEDKEIAKVKKEEGKDIELPEEPKHNGYKFTGWDPDPEKMEESGKTYSTYEEDENEEDEDVEITFMDIDDPKDQDKEDNYKNELGKVKKEGEEGILDDKSIPKVPEHDGWKFSEWKPNPDEMTKSGKTYAKYVEEDKAIEITFMDIDDPSKQDDTEQYEQLGKPVSKEKDKDVDLPKVPEHEGYKFEKWDPEPNKMEESGKTYAKYVEDKKEESEGKKDFTVKIVNPDPEDPENPKSYEDVASLKVLVKDDAYLYKSEDLEKAAKELKATDADKSSAFETAAKENKDAFSKVDNIAKLSGKNKPYEFLGWAGPDGKEANLEDIISKGPEDGKEELTVKAKYSNDMKAKHTDIDFFIVPMKGLKDKESKESK